LGTSLNKITSGQFRSWLWSVLVILGLAVLAGCGSSNNPCGPGVGTSSGSSGGTSSGSASGGSNCGGGGGGGGGGTGGSGTSALLYYLGTSNNVQAAGFNSSGTFANLSPYTSPTLPSAANSMAIVNGQFLYIPTGGFGNVQAYSIDRTGGALTAISGSPFAAQAADDTVTTDPAGRFLFVGGRFSSSISVYAINAATGALTPAPGSPFQSFNLVFANSLTVDSSGKFLYVGQTYSSYPVVGFSIDQTTGALAEIPGSPFPLGVAVVRAAPNAAFLLGIADDSGVSGNKHLYLFSINSSTGVPSLVAGSPTTTVSVPFALAIHPSGAFVYLSVADASGTITSLEGYQLNTASGTLTALPQSPFTTLPPLAECQFEQTGGYAFCLNANGFSALGVNTSTGNLSHLLPDLNASGDFPFAVTDQ